MLSTIVTFVFVTLIMVLFRIRIGRAEKPYKDNFAKFMEMDREANLARRNEISAEHFVTPDIDGLRLREFENLENFESEENKILISKQRALLKASKLKMIKFNHGISNIELKQLYGVANLEEIARYEDNYSVYIHALINYARELANRGFYDDAENALTNGISFGLDLTAGYMLLADVYSDTGKRDELVSLHETVISGELWNAALTDKVAAYIESKIDNGE